MATTKESGPLLAGWLLGGQLKQARLQADKSVAETAQELGINHQTLRRWENAEVTPGLLQIRGLFDFYKLNDDTRREIERLRARAAEPGWWNGNGKWPDTTAELLGMEQAAVQIRSFDLTAIPGTLQTPEYARIIVESVWPTISPAQLDADVQLRTARQSKLYGGTALRKAVYIIDELAFERMPGSASVRRSQLARLLSPPEPATIQVLPFSAGAHPGLGSFVIFDFDSTVIPAGVYVEGSVTAKAVVATGGTVDRFEQVWGWLQAKALTPAQTKKFLQEKAKRYDEDD